MITVRSNPSPIAADLDEIVSRTVRLWEGVRGQSVFLTGGTGFFGRWLLESFAEANRQLELDARLIVLARDPDRFRRQAPDLFDDEAIHFVRGDVRNIDVTGLMARFEDSVSRPIAHIIHAASETTVAANRDHPAQVIQTSLEGTARMLECAGRMKTRTFLLVSSGAVYGPQPTALDRVPEDYSGAPHLTSTMSAYGEGKRVAELLCNIQRQNHGLDCRVARCFAFVGPHLALDAHYAIGNFLRDALTGETIRVNGDGSPFRSYLYSADLAVWLWTLLLHPGAHGSYNVGSDAALSIADVALCVARNCLPSPTVSIAREADPLRPAERYIPDITRARRELGLDVWTPLDAAVRKTLKFHGKS